MKYINKLIAFIGMLGCIAGLILSITHEVELGSWGISSFILGIVFFGIMSSWRGILTWFDNNFDIEYNKAEGLKVKEREGKK